MSPEEIKKILEEHKLWLDSAGKEGRRAVLLEANLQNIDLLGVDFQHADLHGANFQNANLEGSNFQNAGISFAKFQGANLRKANLERADLKGVNLERAYLEKANLEEANLQAAKLQKANLQNASLVTANLQRANLQGALLQRAILILADLRDADLRDVRLWGASLLKAKLDQVNFEGADLRGIYIDNETIFTLPKLIIEKYGISFFVGGMLDYADNENLIIRSIEFPPEYHQAGISILNYFGSVLRKKYPDQTAKVKIEQEDLKVTMIIDPLEGDREVIEKALDEYGLVITGKKPLQEFTDDKLFKIDLKNKLLLAKTEIEMQNKLIAYQDSAVKRGDLQIYQLLSSVGQAIQNPAKYEIHIPVLSHSEASITQEINITQQTSLIHESLNDLKEQLQTGSREAVIIIELQESLEWLDQDKSPKEVARSQAMSKFRRFLEDVENAKTTAGKVIKTAKDGIDIARKLAGYYNDIAQWCELPQVPKPFTKT